MPLANFAGKAGAHVDPRSQETCQQPEVFQEKSLALFRFETRQTGKPGVEPICIVHTEGVST